jgi:hypothetical protein
MEIKHINEAVATEKKKWRKHEIQREMENGGIRDNT